MELPEFLSQFDEELKKYAEKPEPKSDESFANKMYQYLAHYCIEGSSGNTAVKFAVKKLMEDPVFLARLAPALEYVISVTMAAINAAHDLDKEGDK